MKKLNFMVKNRNLVIVVRNIIIELFIILTLKSFIWVDSLLVKRLMKKFVYGDMLCYNEKR